MSQQINLFNPLFRKQKKYFSSVAMLQALAIICIGCALLAVDAGRRARMLDSQAAATDAQLLASQSRLAQFKVQYAPRPKSTTLAAEIAAAQQELAMLAAADDTVRRGGFGDTTGFSGYFRAFARQAVEGMWLTELAIADGGAHIGVRGNVLNAELVPQFVNRLAQEPVMKGKSFSSLDIDRPKAAAGADGAAPAQAARYLSFSLQSAGASHAAVAVK